MRELTNRKACQGIQESHEPQLNCFIQKEYTLLNGGSLKYQAFLSGNCWGDGEMME